jgi:hypothetical protein
MQPPVDLAHFEAPGSFLSQVWGYWCRKQDTKRKGRYVEVGSGGCDVEEVELAFERKGLGWRSAKIWGRGNDDDDESQTGRQGRARMQPLACLKFTQLVL